MGQTPGNRKQTTDGLAPREAAAVCLQRVLEGQRTLDDAIASVLGGAMPTRDRNQTRAIVTTALRRKGEIDQALSCYLAKPLPAKSGTARYLLAIAAAELLFLRTPAHAAIDVAVTLARRDRNARHFAGLLNAVLRKISRHALAGEADPPHLNTPDWLWTRWTASYGEDTAHRIAETHLETPPLDVTVKEPARIGEWADKLGGDILATGTVRITQPTGPVPHLPGFSDGAWWVQDAAAALPVAFLGDIAGCAVLDLCAAPGGKTAQLVARGADVVALDRSKDRLQRLQANLNRLGLEARCVCEDAATYQSDRAFDAVLVDTPCSATGTIRRHPDLPYLKSTEHLSTLSDIQAGILKNAVTLTRAGGTIVYCTCSLEPQECEHQIDRLLAAGAPVERVAIEPSEVSGQPHLLSAKGDLRTLPFHHIDDARGMDGFYACRLRRI